MLEILPGVYLAPMNERKGFGYSHFVVRPAGNLVLDTSRIGSLSDCFDAMEALGGVKAAVISDRHLGGRASNELAERFSATIYCSEIEAQAMDHRVEAVRIDRRLPFQRTVVEDDVLLVPTPGHTEGQFSILVEVQGARILFTADFVWRERGRWRPGNLSRKKIAKSFEGLRDLAFDFVAPWTSYEQTEFLVSVSDVEATVDEMIAACSKP